MTMEHNNDNAFNKVSTGIDGLDDLLYGGLRLKQQKENDKDDNANGIIIVVEGARGISKTMFAMQIMCGIQTNMERRTNGKPYPSLFCSINKGKEELTNMLVGQYIESNIRKIRYDTGEVAPNWFEDNFILPSGVSEGDIRDFVRQGLIVYNHRTQSLHFVTSQGTDNNYNLFAQKKDNIDNIKNEVSNNDDNVFIEFDDDNDPSCNILPLQKYQQVIQKLSDNTNSKLYSCVVVEGFVALLDSEIQNLNWNYLEKTLRRKSMVSILVLDERAKEVHHNADIIIDMRRNEYIDKQSPYTFYELQISKSLSQITAYGWHIYKPNDVDIVVYPSLHRWLQQRHSTSTALLQLEINSMTDACTANEYIRFLYEDDRNEQQEIIRMQGGIGFSKRKNQLSQYEAENNVIENHELFDWVQKKRSEINYSETNIQKFYENIITKQNTHGEEIVVLLFNKTKQYLKNTLSTLKSNKPDIAQQLDKIHTWEIKNGFIPAEEILYTLNQYVKYKRRLKINQAIHFVIDDMRNTDMGYPLIKNNILFIPAMINYCKYNQINLDIFITPTDNNDSIIPSTCVF